MPTPTARRLSSTTRRRSIPNDRWSTGASPIRHGLDASSGRTIDVHIRRLRVKLSSGPVPAPAIVAVRGFGYKMAVEDAVSGANGAAA